MNDPIPGPSAPMSPPNDSRDAVALALPARDASSVFALFVGLGLLILVAFFGASLVAIGMRWSRGSAPPAPAVAAPGTSASPGAAPEAPAKPAARGVVKVPAGRANGVLRAGPGQDSALVALVPDGTGVELGSSTVVRTRGGPQTWIQVRVTVNGAPREGWMHSDILQRE